MGTDRAFNQVKSILGKLDRSIDEARAKRLGDPDPAVHSAKAITQGEAQAASQLANGTTGAPGAIGPGTLIGKSERDPSPFGRARPIPFKG